MVNLVSEKSGTIKKISETAKVFPFEFGSALSRGSQFMVEGAFIKIAKKKNYVLLSATKLQVAHQPALKCQALLLEPAKQFFVE